MSERGPEFEPTPEPGMLDLIRIEGRWAQAISGPGQSMVRYLDGGPHAQIDWSEYRLVQKFGTHVGNLEKSTGLSLSSKEFNQIHTGYDQRSHEDSANDVHVFGEYERRETPEDQITPE